MKLQNYVQLTRTITITCNKDTLKEADLGGLFLSCFMSVCLVSVLLQVLNTTF